MNKAAKGSIRQAMSALTMPLKDPSLAEVRKNVPRFLAREQDAASKGSVSFGQIADAETELGAQLEKDPRLKGLLDSAESDVQSALSELWRTASPPRSRLPEQ